MNKFTISKATIQEYTESRFGATAWTELNTWLSNVQKDITTYFDNADTPVSYWGVDVVQGFGDFADETGANKFAIIRVRVDLDGTRSRWFCGNLVFRNMFLDKRLAGMLRSYLALYMCGAISDDFCVM